MKANQNLPLVAESKSKAVWIVVAIAIILALVVVYFLVFAKGKNALSGKLETTSDFQAVFLDNGQVYFGKLSREGHWLKLMDVYYLQVENSELQAAGSSGDSEQAEQTPNSTDIKLVKLGSELHGPQDEMYIDPSDVMFWENMKDSSKVMEAIKDFKSN